jgi:hypothetical protein
VLAHGDRVAAVLHDEVHEHEQCEVVVRLEDAHGADSLLFSAEFVEHRRIGAEAMLQPVEEQFVGHDHGNEIVGLRVATLGCLESGELLPFGPFGALALKQSRVRVPSSASRKAPLRRGFCFQGDNSRSNVVTKWSRSQRGRVRFSNRARATSASAHVGHTTLAPTPGESTSRPTERRRS